MMLCEFIWTFGGVVSAIAFGIIILTIIAWGVYGVISFIMHKLFYKNCRNCKKFKLHNVTSYGGFASYKCEETDKVSKNLQQNEDYWKKCNKFEKKK